MGSERTEKRRYYARAFLKRLRSDSYQRWDPPKRRKIEQDDTLILQMIYQILNNLWFLQSQVLHNQQSSCGWCQRGTCWTHTCSAPEQAHTGSFNFFGEAMAHHDLVRAQSAVIPKPQPAEKPPGLKKVQDFPMNDEDEDIGCARRSSIEELYNFNSSIPVRPLGSEISSHEPAKAIDPKGSCEAAKPIPSGQLSGGIDLFRLSEDEKRLTRKERAAKFCKNVDFSHSQLSSTTLQAPVNRAVDTPKRDDSVPKELAWRKAVQDRAELPGGVESAMNLIRPVVIAAQFTPSPKAPLLGYFGEKTEKPEAIIVTPAFKKDGLLDRVANLSTHKGLDEFSIGTQNNAVQSILETGRWPAGKEGVWMPPRPPPLTSTMIKEERDLKMRNEQKGITNEIVGPDECRCGSCKKIFVCARDGLVTCPHCEVQFKFIRNRAILHIKKGTSVAPHSDCT